MNVMLQKTYKTDSRPGTDLCLAEGLNRIYSRDFSERFYRLPQALGEGYCRRIILSPELEVNIYDFCFQREFTLEETTYANACHITFNLADEMEYTIRGSGELFALERDDSCVYRGKFIDGFHTFIPGEHCYGITLTLHPGRFADIFEYLQSVQAITRLESPLVIGKKFKITALAKRILEQIVNCSYQERARGIYIEGKVLELIAFYVQEIVGSGRTEPLKMKFSPEEAVSLRQAKEILDLNYADPPTLTQLARLVCLNELKLKKGFKESYGMPVYAYIMEKRMEAARILLEEKKLKVKEIASQVGYTNISHFGEAFRKKYGLNPGEYLRG